MTFYKDDRGFTDFVHRQLAVSKIYSRLGWNENSMNPDLLEHIDVHHGIDYVMTNEKGMTVNIQERFRDSFYKSYSDATLRFRREFNPHPKRIKSEFYKIKADYLVYGITNGKKFADARHTLTDFLKWVVLDLKFIKKQYEDGQIAIVTSRNTKCWVEKGILKCPENYNSDKSSSFVPFSIPLLCKIWGSEPIFAQGGFIG